MNIDEVMELKDALEKDLLSRVELFEKETNISIDSIGLEEERWMGPSGDKHSKTVGVRVLIEVT